MNEKEENKNPFFFHKTNYIFPVGFLFCFVVVVRWELTFGIENVNPMLYPGAM